MYDALVNKILAWPTTPGQAIMAVSSFDQYLMNVTLSKCGVLGQDNDDSEPVTSLWLRNLLADQSRKFTIIGSVYGYTRDNHGASLRVVSPRLYHKLLET